MCDDKSHWTFRIEKFLETDCSCCLIWRGLALGFLAGLVVAGAIALLAAAL
jgi:hypothetical protein